VNIQKGVWAVLILTLSISAQDIFEFTKTFGPDTIWKAGTGINPEKTTIQLRATTTGEGVDTIKKYLFSDVLLAFDLSGSMNTIEGGSLPRITWAQLSALRFVDSLKENDRVAVLGWTATDDYAVLADTSDPSTMYLNYRPFTGELDSVRDFIKTNLFLDGSYAYAVVNGDTLVRRNQIPGGNFNDTPRNIATISGANYLVKNSLYNTKVLILMTDGENDDNVPMGQVLQHIDSLRQTDSIVVFTISFRAGQNQELKDIAQAGGGLYYHASTPSQLDSVYAKIARSIKVLNTIIAYEVDTLSHGTAMVYEVLPSHVNLVPGSVFPTSNNTITIDSFGIAILGSSTVLQWFVNSISLDDVFEVNYSLTSDSAGPIAGNVTKAMDTANYSRLYFMDFSGELIEEELIPTTLFVNSIERVGIQDQGQITDDSTFNIKLIDTIQLSFDLEMPFNASFNFYSHIWETFGIHPEKVIWKSLSNTLSPALFGSSELLIGGHPAASRFIIPSV